MLVLSVLSRHRLLEHIAFLIIVVLRLVTALSLSPYYLKIDCFLSISSNYRNVYLKGMDDVCLNLVFQNMSLTDGRHSPDTGQ